MITRLNSLEDFKELKVGDNVILVTTKGKELVGTIEKELENRGYIDVNEITVNIDDEYDLTVNVDKYLMDLGKLKDLLDKAGFTDYNDVNWNLYKEEDFEILDLTNLNRDTLITLFS